MGPQDDNVALVMDRAYQGDETRQLALDLGFTPVVPPLKTRTDPWEYDREMYKRRNEVERLFRRLKGYRRIFSRFEKLDVMFIGFIHFVLIFDAQLRCVRILPAVRPRHSSRRAVITSSTRARLSSPRVRLSQRVRCVALQRRSLTASESCFAA